jgi:hypothetical protein
MRRISSPKWKLSSKHALDYLCVELPFWVGVILILEGSFIRGAAVVLCWVLFLVLTIRRELKMELITDRRDRRSFAARTAFLVVRELFFATKSRPEKPEN